MANLFLIGDSMIEFFDWNRRFPNHRVVNLGRSGETASELLGRLPGIMALQPEPDWLLIMTGTNDICMENYSFPSTVNMIAETCRRYHPDAAVTINSILPIALPYLAPNTVPRINNILKELATDKDIHFLDAYSALTAPTDRQPPKVLDADGVHLNDHGYRLWANEIEKHLLAILS